MPGNQIKFHYMCGYGVVVSGVRIPPPPARKTQITVGPPPPPWKKCSGSVDVLHDALTSNLKFIRTLGLKSYISSLVHIVEKKLLDLYPLQHVMNSYA